MTTPSDPYETPGENQPPRYSETPPPGQGQPGQTPPGYPPQYGQQPAYPQYGQQPATPEPPPSILTAVKLMYAGAILSLLWTLLVLPQRDVIRDAFDEQDIDMTASEIDTLVNGVLGFMVVFGLITIVLWIVMARTNQAGKSWARVVATILGVLAILIGLIGLLQVDVIGLVMNLALMGLAGWILVLLYRRESSEYYNAVSRPRF